MTAKRLLPTATLLGTGDVLEAGGFATDSVSSLVTNSSAELFSCTSTCPTGVNCGTVAACDGTTLNCGPACTAPETCGGGGTQNVCGCAPITACPAGDNCGTIPDTCGGTVSCGTCLMGETCTNNVCGVAGTDAGTTSSTASSTTTASSTSTASSSASSTGHDAGTASSKVHDAGKASDCGDNEAYKTPTSSSCSTGRTAPRQDVPSSALLLLGAVGLFGVRRMRRRAA